LLIGAGFEFFVGKLHMKKQPRRNFIRSCLYAVISGMSLGVFALCSGFGKKKTHGFSKSARGNDGSHSGDRIPEPSYLELHRSGELRERGEELWQIMERCRLCPRMCGVNKLKGEKGFCGADSRLMISAFHQHFGEEDPLVGRGGSGTIFLTNCGLRCVFCCNWEISQGGRGQKRTLEEMADMMLTLQGRGCPNINFVTPTHYSPHIVLAVDIAARKGLHIPLVYNTCGWERVEIIRKLDGIVDIYLPDFKYADGTMADKYSSGALTYPELTKNALLEMHRQVGVAKPEADGLMYRGLMIRHLVMPNNVGGSKEVISWIAGNLPKDTYVNIMSQYRPQYKAGNYPEIARRITRKEYTEVVEWARQEGLANLEIQGYYF
jgi:putative pyruvate formate lyase activating enzyme